MRGLNLDGFSGGDRTSLDLPEVQRRLIRRIVATGKPVTLVLMTGSAVSINSLRKRYPLSSRPGTGERPQGQLWQMCCSGITIRPAGCR